MKWKFWQKKKQTIPVDSSFAMGFNYWDAWITINDSKQNDPTWPVTYRRIADENLKPVGQNTWEDLWHFIKKLAEAAKE